MLNPTGSVAVTSPTDMALDLPLYACPQDGVVKHCFATCVAVASPTDPVPVLPVHACPRGRGGLMRMRAAIGRGLMPARVDDPQCAGPARKTGWSRRLLGNSLPNVSCSCCQPADRALCRPCNCPQDGVVKEVCCAHALEIAQCVAELDR